eukprot:10186911-Alexandrium_andersonii.AAC.1
MPTGSPRFYAKVGRGKSNWRSQVVGSGRAACFPLCFLALMTTITDRGKASPWFNIPLATTPMF